MFSVCGVSGYHLSLFHLVNHAFVKALLFLSAGALIHNLFFEQDIRRMGSLGKYYPLTFIFFFIGSFALMGLPFFSGFYSKDLIIELFYIKITISGKFAF
jgi:NADH:ubiquinone oxidoreductase subunit 5 (subunit L)/multisubunit Na+/H+ antiporter MnhA subunit